MIDVNYPTTPEGKAKRFLEDSQTFSGTPSEYFKNAKRQLHDISALEDKIVFWNKIDAGLFFKLDSRQDYHKNISDYIKKELSQLNS